MMRCLLRALAAEWWGDQGIGPRKGTKRHEKNGVVEVGLSVGGLTTDDTDGTDETQGSLVLRGNWASGTTEYTEDTEGMLFGGGGFEGDQGVTWSTKGTKRHEKRCGVGAVGG